MYKKFNASPKAPKAPVGSTPGLVTPLDMTRSCSLHRSGYGAFRLFLGLGSNGVGVGLGERLDVTLLAVLYSQVFRQSPSARSPCSSAFTHSPLGETEVHLAAALGVQAGSLLERPAHGAGGDGQVAVVASSG
jgi:hypothetical protein